MISPPLVVLLILVAACVPGVLVLRLWRRRLSNDPVEFAFTALSLGLLLIGWFALLLAEIGRFSLASLGVSWIVVTTALTIALLLHRSRPAALPPEPPTAWSRWEIAALLAWSVAAAVVYFRPHEFIIGGADAGVYVNLGANIARTGSILVHDPLLGNLDPQLRPALLRAMPPGEAAPFYLLPGFYVTGSQPDLVTPQFFHLHPAWQAVGYTLGGLPAELWITPLWGLLGCLAVYMTVRALWGWRPALLALVALSVTALQVWFARYPTSEALTQFLFWTGAWAVAQWLARKNPPGLWATVAGLALGEVFLARVDSYVLLALPLILALWFTLNQSWHRDAVWFFAPFLLMAAHSMAHGLLITQPYFSLLTLTGIKTLLGSASRRIGFALAGASLAAFALAVIWLRRRPGRREKLSARFDRLVPVVLSIGAVLVILLALYAYFIRPQLDSIRVGNYWYGGGQLPTLDRENLVRLGWYISPVGIALGVAGIAWMIVTQANRRTAFLLLAGGFFALVYLWKMGANPHQVYAMRRYVPQVLPLFIIGGVYLVWRCWSRLHTPGKVSAAVLTLAWIVGIFMCSRPFITQVDYLDIARQVSEVGNALPEKSIVLFGDSAPVGVGDFVGTPLRFLEDKRVFVVREPGRVDATRFDAVVRGWQELGYRVYWAETQNTVTWPASTLKLGAATAYSIETEMLEGSYDHKPSAVLPVVWRFTLAEVLPSPLSRTNEERHES